MFRQRRNPAETLREHLGCCSHCNEFGLCSIGFGLLNRVLSLKETEIDFTEVLERPLVKIYRRQHEKIFNHRH